MDAAVVFFDIGDTLASVRVDSTGTSIEDLVPLAGVRDVLRTLRVAGVRMGVISDRGSIPAAEVDAALARVGLSDFLDPHLVLYGRKDSVRIFEQGAAIARSSGSSPIARLLFVGEDAAERGLARAAGFAVCPHPSLVVGLLTEGSPLRFVRLRVAPSDAATDWRSLLRGRPVVPLHVDVGPTPELYAIASATTALELDDLGFWVDRLGGDDEPLTSDLYLIRDDVRVGAKFGIAMDFSATLFQGRAVDRVLASTGEGLFVAIPAGGSVESLHGGRPRHGHNLKLTALPPLLDVTGAEESAGLAARAVTAEHTSAPVVTPDEVAHLKRKITPSRLRRLVERYSGARPIRSRQTLASRHIHHPDNADAVQALIADLTMLDRGRLAVRTHRFSHEGRHYDNVEAILESSNLPGTVLLTAHLDSTAARQPGYRADVDPAPGADDDGSGMAGVLAAASSILALAARADRPRREFRFVLFNAEEQGLVGSRAYARDAAARGADIVAVLQLDMIGFDTPPARTFELHAGFTPSPTVQQRSIGLAELVAAQVPLVAPTLPTPQLYPGPDGSADPAERRSDHYSFQLVGYPACLASEDFFAGPTPGSPAPDPNPNYHSPSDITVESNYACEIARTVTAAAWLCGTR